MASWDSIRKEAALAGTPDQWDVVRRRKLAAVHKITERPLVIYATDWVAPSPIKAQVAGAQTTISLSDKDGFDEVTRNLPGDSLDVLLHSPGGSAEATESIVELLRARYKHIRFIVPNAAKSAATIMAMAGDQLVMDERSELGPTDPQMILVRDQQQIVAPAQAIKDQFEQAQRQINGNPQRLPGWVPLLQQYGPALLAQCDNLIQLSEVLVSKWLAKYMFAGDPDAVTKAEAVASYLSNHNNFKSHSRRVGIDEIKSLGVNILDMRGDLPLREAVQDLYTSIMLTFSGTGAFKIVENTQKEALIQSIEVNPVGQPPQASSSAPKVPPKQSPPQRPPRGQRKGR